NAMSKVVCVVCKKCLNSVNHDVCLNNCVNGKKSRGRKPKANVSKNETQQKNQPKIKKSKSVGTHKSLATPKPRKPRFIFRWSPTGRLFDYDGKLVASSKSESQVDCSNGDNACCSKHMTGNIKVLINFVWKFMGTVRFGNDHVAAILGFGDLQWGNILITRVYFVEGLGHNVFSVGQFCDSDLEVAFRRNACFDLARNDLVAGLPNFKYHKEHLCPSCEQGKSKRASHPPKPVPNTRQRLHLLHMDLCGPMRIASINGKRLFDHDGKLVASSKSESQVDYSNGCSKHMMGNLKLLINFVWKFMGTVRFGNDHVAAILGFGDLQWGNILITRVYFVEGLGHNLFSVGQFCDSDLEVAFRRNACFVRNLEGVDLLKGDRSINLYTINLHEMASASPICLMARASSTKSWLWHQ
nr:integrase, catalytic region, zinc finger, CCHC-type, peptidase aspartic, catalytic [Tanacetum cinerariifolium]